MLVWLSMQCGPSTVCVKVSGKKASESYTWYLVITGKTAGCACQLQVPVAGLQNDATVCGNCNG